MIPLFTGSASPTATTTRNPLVYNGLTYNSPVGSDPKEIVEIHDSQAQSIIQTVTERHEFTDGTEVYNAYKVQKRLVQRGIIRSATKGGLFDRIEELSAAFDPAQVSHDNPTTAGFLPLDFDVPTADLTTYPTGLIACRYYVRAERAIEPPASQFTGDGTPVIISLLAKDPRRYTQATSQLTGAGTLDNTASDYWSWPTLSIAMTGAGSATFEIGNSTVGYTLVLDLSGLLSGDAVAVDMEGKGITVNGVSHPELKVSGKFFWIEPGSNTITVTNTTNASPTLTWRTAFSF